MDIQSTDEFRTWATGFSGCDGGNRHGAIWFCGIEYGGNEVQQSFCFSDVSEPAYLVADQLESALAKSPYVRKVAKLYAVLRGSEPSNYHQIAQAHRLFDKGSDAFRINLFPISFHSDSDELWQRWLYEKTGLPTKSLYRAWCQLYRFPQMKQWVYEGNPKVIVATGIGYKGEFAFAFAGVQDSYRQEEHHECIAERPFAWRLINNGHTVLAVTPFLGHSKYALNSDSIIRSFGLRIREICTEQFGSRWIGDA